MSHFCCSCLTFLIENISLKWSCHHHYDALQNVGLYICSASIAFEQRGILIVPHLYCNMQSLGLLSWPELKVFWSSVVRILVFSIPTKLGTKHLWTKEIQVCLIKGHALLKNEIVKIPWRLRISFSRTTVPTLNTIFFIEMFVVLCAFLSPPPSEKILDPCMEIAFRPRVMQSTQSDLR